MTGACFAVLALILNAGPIRDVRCGAHCLYVALVALDIAPIKYAELQRTLGEPTISGYSLHDLARAAEKLGAKVLPLELPLDDVGKWKRPFACIAHMRQGHYVLIADIADGRAWLVDPPQDRWVPLDTLREEWTGYVLLIGRDEVIPLPEESRVVAYWIAIPAIFVLVAVVIAWIASRRRRSGGLLGR